MAITDPEESSTHCLALTSSHPEAFCRFKICTSPFQRRDQLSLISFTDLAIRSKNLIRQASLFQTNCPIPAPLLLAGGVTPEEKSQKIILEYILERNPKIYCHM